MTLSPLKGQKRSYLVWSARALKMPNTIQPLEYSRGGGRDGALYITDSDGDLKVFNVEHNDNGQWLNSNNGNPANVWNPDNQWVFVLPRNLLHFSPILLGEFCFCNWPCHPPSILPTSSIFIDNATYFLLSRDLVSQSTMRSIFRVSSFLIARRTCGCFSSRVRKLARAIASMISTNRVSILCPREWR